MTASDAQGYIENPVTFESDGLTLAGILGMPSELEPKRRGVVLIHGWGGYRIGPGRLLVQTARRLNAEGFFTLRFDLRGRGDSEGRADTVCLDDMIADTVAAVEFLSRQKEVQDVVLLGICSGSNVAVGAATLKPDLGKQLALWSILPFQPDVKARQHRKRKLYFLKRYAQKACRLETWKRLFRGEVDVRGVQKTIKGDAAPKTGEANLKDSRRDIMADFSRFRGRALFITGSQDPEGMAGWELFTRFCSEKKIDAQFTLVEGATHSYYRKEHKTRVIDTTVEWLGGS